MKVDLATITETRLENISREMERIEVIYLRDVRGHWLRQALNVMKISSSTTRNGSKLSSTGVLVC